MTRAKEGRVATEATASRSATEERGEMTLMLAGVPMGLRPSYEAIDAIEKAMGRGLVDIARDAIAGRLSLSETAQVATELVRAWGRDGDNRDAAGSQPERIARLILDSEGGIHRAMSTVSAVCSLAVTGGYDSSGNLKPATTTKVPSAAG